MKSILIVGVTGAVGLAAFQILQDDGGTLVTSLSSITRSFASESPAPAICAAAGNGDVAAIEAKLRAGASIAAKDEAGRGPLAYAAGNNQTAAFRFLLARGADAHAQDDIGNTPLHAAAEAGAGEIVDLLLAQRADINKQNEFGETPLICAAMRGHIPVMQRLLAAGAIAGMTGSDGRTAYDWAHAGHHFAAAKLLQDVPR